MNLKIATLHKTLLPDKNMHTGTNKEGAVKEVGYTVELTQVGHLTI